MMTCKTIKCFNQFLDVPKKDANSDAISVWQLKGLSNKSFIVSAASNSFAPSLDYVVATLFYFGGKRSDKSRV